MKVFISSLAFALCVFSGVDLFAAVRVYMLPEVLISGNAVYVQDICKIEGPGALKYLDIAVQPGCYRDNLIDRVELKNFLKSCFNEDVTVFGNGTMISWELKHEIKKEIVTARAVQRGDLVQVLVNTGNIKIRLTGRSLSDGAINDEIEIRLKSGKRIRCIITGDRQARKI